MTVDIVRFHESETVGWETCNENYKVSLYLSRCHQLWSALSQSGVVVLEIPDDTDALVQLAFDSSDRFFSLPSNEKLSASSSFPGEGYSRRSGKEVLAFRMGLPSGGRQPGRQVFSAACTALDRLGRAVLRDVCRCRALNLHPSGLSGLLEDAPFLQDQPSASVLRCSSFADAGSAVASRAYAPHHGRGLLTLVASRSVRGLQVRLDPGSAASGGGSNPGGGSPPHSGTSGGGSSGARCAEGAGGSAAPGEWVDVPLGPGRVAVLAGCSLSYALGGLVRPVLRRAVPEAGAAAAPRAAAGGSAAAAAAAAGGRRVWQEYELCCRPTAVVDPRAILQESSLRPAGPLSQPLPVTELTDVLEDLLQPLSTSSSAAAAAAAATGPARQLAAAMGLFTSDPDPAAAAAPSPAAALAGVPTSAFAVAGSGPRLAKRAVDPRGSPIREAAGVRGGGDAGEGGSGSGTDGGDGEGHRPGGPCVNQLVSDGSATTGDDEPALAVAQPDAVPGAGRHGGGAKAACGHITGAVLAGARRRRSDEAPLPAAAVAAASKGADMDQGQGEVTDPDLSGALCGGGGYNDLPPAKLRRRGEGDSAVRPRRRWPGTTIPPPPPPLVAAGAALHGWPVRIPGLRDVCGLRCAAGFAASLPLTPVTDARPATAGCLCPALQYHCRDATMVQLPTPPAARAIASSAPPPPLPPPQPGLGRSRDRGQAGSVAPAAVWKPLPSPESTPPTVPRTAQPPPPAVTTAAAAAAATSTAVPVLEIVIQNRELTRTFVRVRPSTYLCELYRAYAGHYGLEPRRLAFLHEGRRLGPWERVDEAGLEDGDVMDVMADVAGCGSRASCSP